MEQIGVEALKSAVAVGAVAYIGLAVVVTVFIFIVARIAR